MAILTAGPQNFTLAVMTGDEKLLTAAQGVGKKLAQRIILELKDKLGGSAMELFGFATTEELNLFQKLISVTGVGPKAALSILSANTPANLALSIITGDEKALTMAQGIGKKIAQRIILELKDKLAKGQMTLAGESYGGSGVTIIPENKTSEATAALAVLGYSQGEIQAALKGVDLDGLTLEQIIKAALKKMMK